jgi:hypothetical protein
MEAPALEGDRDVINDFLVYPPGVQTPPHRHPGPNFVTLVDGEITLTRPDSGDETTYDAPASWIEDADELHWGTTGDPGATILTSTVVPRGQPRAVPAAPPPPEGSDPLPLAFFGGLAVQGVGLALRRRRT